MTSFFGVRWRFLSSAYFQSVAVIRYVAPLRGITWGYAAAYAATAPEHCRSIGR